MRVRCPRSSASLDNQWFAVDRQAPIVSRCKSKRAERGSPAPEVDRQNLVLAPRSDFGFLRLTLLFEVLGRSSFAAVLLG
jgi:hypothetical protein